VKVLVAASADQDHILLFDFVDALPLTSYQNVEIRVLRDLLIANHVLIRVNTVLSLSLKFDSTASGRVLLSLGPLAIQCIDFLSIWAFAHDVAVPSTRSVFSVFVSY